MKSSQLPAFLRLSNYVLGSISFGLAYHGHFYSEWKMYYGPVGSNQEDDWCHSIIDWNHETDRKCPGVNTEHGFLIVTLISLVYSQLSLFAAATLKLDHVSRKYKNVL